MIELGERTPLIAHASHQIRPTRQMMVEHFEHETLAQLSVLNLEHAAHSTAPHRFDHAIRSAG